MDKAALREAGWTRTAQGWMSRRGWSATDPSSYMLIRPVAGRWRLTAVQRPGHGGMGKRPAVRKDFWEAATVAECLDIQHSRDRYEQDLAAFARRGRAYIERESPMPGVVLKAWKELAGAQVEAWRGDRRVGRFHAIYTGWEATWILGEPTLNTDSFVDQDIKGRGVGRAMHDIMEEVSGLPLAPHGRNGVEGSLSDDAEIFWEKRARHQRVPGMGNPDVQERHARIDEIMNLFTIETVCRFDSSIMTAVSLATGWPLQAARRVAQDGHEVVREAWCVAPDGQAFTGRGFEPLDDVHRWMHSDAALEGAFGWKYEDQSAFPAITGMTAADLIGQLAVQSGSQLADDEDDDEDETLAEREIRIRESIVYNSEDADLLMRRHLGRRCLGIQEALDACQVAPPADVPSAAPVLR